MLNTLLQTLLRKKTPVNFSDLNRKEPISHFFGLDRGTPIDRYYIKKFLHKNAKLIKGRVLEIAESRYSKLYGGNRIEAFEVLHATPDNKNATIIGDLTDA